MFSMIGEFIKKESSSGIILIMPSSYSFLPKSFRFSPKSFLLLYYKAIQYCLNVLLFPPLYYSLHQRFIFRDFLPQRICSHSLIMPSSYSFIFHNKVYYSRSPFSPVVDDLRRTLMSLPKAESLLFRHFSPSENEKGANRLLMMILIKFNHVF